MPDLSAVAARGTSALSKRTTAEGVFSNKCSEALSHKATPLIEKKRITVEEITDGQSQ